MDNNIEAFSKVIGLVIATIGVDKIFSGNYVIAIVLFFLGGVISIIPLLIDHSLITKCKN